MTHTATSDPRTVTSDIYSHSSTMARPIFDEPEDDFDSTALLIDRVETLTNHFGLLQHQILQQPVNWSTPIYDLGEDGYILSTPISVNMQEYADEETIIARFPELNLLGEGVTEAEALSNLKIEILDLFDELQELNFHEMGDVPKSWLRILKGLISKVSS